MEERLCIGLEGVGFPELINQDEVTNWKSYKTENTDQCPQQLEVICRSN